MYVFGEPGSIHNMPAYHYTASLRNVRVVEALRAQIILDRIAQQSREQILKITLKHQLHYFYFLLQSFTQ